jgi:hypothetical protein
MKHIIDFKSHNENVLTWITGGDETAKAVLKSLDRITQEDIVMEDESPICISYSWTTDSKILYEKRIEVVKYSKTIVLMVDDQEVRSSGWLRRKVWEKVSEICGSNK